MQRLFPVLLLLCAGAHALAQSPTHFRARLSTVPIDLVMQKVVAGRGTVKATLVGNTLTVNGEFEGLVSPATLARLHTSPNKGIRGSQIHDLTVTTAQRGTLSAALVLTPSQIEALKAGRLYIQLHSERAPDGNLWGWLLPAEGRR